MSTTHKEYTLLYISNEISRFLGLASSVLLGLDFCFQPSLVLRVLLAEVVPQGLVLWEALAAEVAEVELDTARSNVTLAVALSRFSLTTAAD